MQELKEAIKRKPSFWKTIRAVLWSFFGVRKGSGYAEDVGQLNPLHLIIAGILCAMIFIATLLFIVSRVVAQ
ncbi:MAG: DUF2970 domain-containing protein [Burkholderiales bacterium]|nr:DUF2970 domain-containing protein [Burkholderiales bacterium]